jgi:hypothetical protein
MEIEEETGNSPDGLRSLTDEEIDDAAADTGAGETAPEPPPARKASTLATLIATAEDACSS